MKIKQINGTSNFAWSPAGLHPISLVSGTAAQQVDATFSTSASMEIHSLNPTQPGLAMTQQGTLNSEHRFYKLVWGCHGMIGGDLTSGVVVGGTDGGSLNIYDADKLINSPKDGLIIQQTQHTGPVEALDFNPFQPNLLASGAGESGILIWDLKSPNKPMSPGTKSLPLDGVTSVAWNKQVQHILASTFSSRCVLWDLRKNESIIKLSDPATRMRCKMVAWHPTNATQLCLASEDDYSPTVQLWDLKFATSPLKRMECHQRGVMSVAWCPYDSDLILSCGKDNHVLCWNPNTNDPNGEIVCDLTTDGQWNFDVEWCPRNPNLIAVASFDSGISIHSILGAQSDANEQLAYEYADTFLQTEMSQQKQTNLYLKTAPKWLKRPVGVSFGFGGKLVSFDKETNAVFVSQVVTEPEIIEEAAHLESALNSNNLLPFCENKVALHSNDPELKRSWLLIKTEFEIKPRDAMMSLLGFNISCEDIKIDPTSNNFCPFETMPSELSLSLKSQSGSGESNTNLKHSLLVGNINEAAKLLVQEEAWTEALILAERFSSELFQEIQQSYLKKNNTPHSKLIYSIANNNWHQIIAECNQNTWKDILVSFMTYSKKRDFSSLCQELGKRLLEIELPYEAMVCYIITGNVEALSQTWLQCHSSNLTPKLLQELIEQVMVLKKLHTDPILIGPTLSSLLSEYIIMLCSQGALALASTLLNDSNFPSLSHLKDRISIALGLRSQFYEEPYQAKPYNSFQGGQAPNYSRSNPSVVPPSSTSSYFNNQNLGNNSFSSFNNQPPPSHIPNLSPPSQNTIMQPSFQSNPSFPSSFNSNIPPPPPKAGMSPPQNFNMPSPPSNTGSYYNPNMPPPLNPNNMPSYNQNVPNPVANLSSNNPSMPPMGIKREFQAYQPPPQSSNIPNPHHLPPMNPNSSYAPPPVPPLSGFQPGKPSAYAPPAPQTAHSNSFYSGSINSPNAFNEQQSAPPTGPIYNPYGNNQPIVDEQQFGSQANSNYNSSARGGYQQPAYLERSATPSTPTRQNMSPVPSEYPTSVPPGWNDPPNLQHRPRSTSIDTRTPIMGPFPQSIFNPASVPEPNIEPPPQYFNQEKRHSYEHSSLMTPASNNAPNNNNIYAAQEALLHQEPLPIPPEHQPIQDVLEELRNHCFVATTNPQLRRKLDELVKKLETLYTKLRERRLSEVTLSSLHQLTQALKDKNYNAAMDIHNYLVSSSNFAEISSFMPGIKVLIHTANSLGSQL